MGLSDRRKLLIAPNLFGLFDSGHVRRAERDFEALSKEGAVSGEARKQVEEIYIPLKLKDLGLKCEMCGWVAPEYRGYLVLHHQKRRLFSAMFLQVYGQRDDWDLKDPATKKFIVDEIVKLHSLDTLSQICVECHCLRCHPENRQLMTRCSGRIEHIRLLKTQQGFTCAMPDYTKA